MTYYGILIHLYDTGMNHIGGVMVSMLASSVVDLGSSHGWDYEISISWFSTDHAALKSKSKDCLSRNQNNVSGWSNMSTRRLLFQ